MGNHIAIDFYKSWVKIDGCINSTASILDWINEKKRTVHVSIEKKPFDPNGFWYFDDKSGTICNRNKSFFSIGGLKISDPEKTILEQPIILQDEIGYLGIICKKIDGILYFLMQAKIEPGNINKVQISPTIQATKSNFTRSHGGKAPAYLDYFMNAGREQIIVDQIQSEQGARFFKKRNRNIVVMIDDEIELLPTHMWMTLGQIKQLMKYDNLVNMDTRTVISCIPFSQWLVSESELIKNDIIVNDPSIVSSLMFKGDGCVFPTVYNHLNNLKMFSEEQRTLVRIDHLQNWGMKNGELVQLNKPGLFKAIYCNIEIEGREVRKWEQPLFEATGIATFGLITYVKNGVRKFIISAKKECGAFDLVELGPTIQQEYGESHTGTAIEQLFWSKLQEKGTRILSDVILSEEGGRFYHEQNRNVIIELSPDEIPDIDIPYFEADLYTINTLIQINNCVNIQLRNLISLLEV